MSTDSQSTSLKAERPSQATRLYLAVAGLVLTAAPVSAQISLTTAADLALTHSPKIRMAEADALKAQASLAEAKDAFVPAVTAGAGLGESYGYSPNPPTLFTFNAQSLVFSRAQRYYIRSGRLGISAAELSLQDAREAVLEDTAETFLALEHDQQREGVLDQQYKDATKLVEILENRYAAGRETNIDLTSGRLNVAQIHLARLRADDDTARDHDHLALLLGMPLSAPLRAEGDIPSLSTALPPAPALNLPATPAVAAAFASARAKEQVAAGDSKFLYRPQLSLLVQYNRYATFTNSFSELQAINSNYKIGPNEGVFAIEIQLPLFDKTRAAKARGEVADALHARAEAENAQVTALDGQFKLRHSIAVLRARAEVATLDQQLAQQQLDALTTQLNAASANPNAPLLTPKDEENSRIAEREKYLAVIDADYQLRQTEINLLRQTGQLEDWFHQAASHPAPLPAVHSPD